MASSKSENVVSSNGCSIQRLPRAWVSLVRPGQSLSVGQADSRLRLLQWNLLADGLAQWGDFIRVRPEVLEWAYRKPLILEEVLQAQADILCFQELNYFDEIKADLAQAGYEGCFLPKRQSPATKYSSPADGVAIFWKANRLTLVERQCLHFTDSNGAPSPQGCMTMLLSDPQGRQLLVATTHLKAKEGADLDAVRLRQMQQVLSSIGATLDRISNPAVVSPAPGAQPSLGTPGTNGALPAAQSGLGSPGTNGASTLTPRASMPIIVAGDFNTTPTSMPCQLLASPPWSFQSIWDTPTDPTHPDRSQDGGEAPPQGAGTSANGQCLVDDAALERSAGYDGQPEFSTWKFRTGGESKRIIDHVWFTGLVPVSRWRMLSEEEIGCDGLPCDKYPSDHIALCCEFEFPPK